MKDAQSTTGVIQILEEVESKYKNTYDFQKPTWSDSIQIEATIATRSNNNARGKPIQQRQHRIDVVQEQYERSKQEEAMQRKSEDQSYNTLAQLAISAPKITDIARLTSARSKENKRDHFSMYNPNNRVMMGRDPNMRKSANLQR